MPKEHPNDWCAIDKVNHTLIDSDPSLHVLHLRLKGRREVRYVMRKDRPITNLLG